MAGLRVGVLGASGYTGGELVRLALGHPEVELAFLGGRDSAGRTLEEVHPHLAGSPAASLRIQPVEEARDLDLAFLALPHGESSTIAPALLEASVRVIDLAGDFRLPAAAYPEWYGFEHPAAAWLEKAVYGLPERFRDQLARRAAGGEPRMLPDRRRPRARAAARARARRAGPVVVDGKTGLSGAGRTAGDAASHVGDRGEHPPVPVPIAPAHARDGARARARDRHRRVASLSRRISCRRCAGS